MQASITVGFSKVTFDDAEKSHRDQTPDRVRSRTSGSTAIGKVIMGLFRINPLAPFMAHSLPATLQ